MLLDRHRIALARGQRLAKIVVPLDALTESIALRIGRPSRRNLGIRYGLDTELRIALVIEADGVQYRAEDFDVGGQRIVARQGRRAFDRDDVELCYCLPCGFFGRREGSSSRLGEGKTEYHAWAEIECLAGSLDSYFEFAATRAPAPYALFHNSVAFDAASAVASTATGTTISLNHTATGTNKAAMIAGWFEMGSATPTALTATYGGNAATQIPGYTQNPAFHIRHDGLYVVDANIAAGSQSVVVTRSGGSGTTDSKGMIVCSMTGVDQTTSVGTPQVAGATSGTTPSVTVSTPASDSLIVDSCFAFTTSGNLTPGANQTLRASDFTSVTDFKVATSTQAGSSGGTVSYTKTNGDEYGIGAVEFLAAGGGTITLTGQSSSSGLGTLAPSTADTLTGSSITSAEGALTTALSLALSGQSITSAKGTAAPTFSIPIVGSAITSAQGTLTATGGGAITLIGQAATFAMGTIGVSLSIDPEGSTVTALEGQAAAGAIGPMTPSDSVPLSGLSSSSGRGTAAPALSVALTGNSITSGRGVLAPALSKALSGLAITSAEGTLTPVSGQSVALTGISATFGAGVFALSASFTLAGLSGAVDEGSLTIGSGNMPSLVGLNVYMALEKLQAAGIYAPLPVFAFEPSTISITWRRSTQYQGGTVIAQSPAYGETAVAGQSVTLTVADFPFGAVIDTPPDWSQLQ